MHISKYRWMDLLSVGTFAKTVCVELLAVFMYDSFTTYSLLTISKPCVFMPLMLKIQSLEPLVVILVYKMWLNEQSCL